MKKKIFYMVGPGLKEYNAQSKNICFLAVVKWHFWFMYKLFALPNQTLCHIDWMSISKLLIRSNRIVIVNFVVGKTFWYK